jgi:hypothetical protein
MTEVAVGLPSCRRRWRHLSASVCGGRLPRPCGPPSDGSAAGCELSLVMSSAVETSLREISPLLSVGRNDGRGGSSVMSLCPLRIPQPGSGRCRSSGSPKWRNLSAHVVSRRLHSHPPLTCPHLLLPLPHRPLGSKTRQNESGFGLRQRSCRFACLDCGSRAAAFTSLDCGSEAAALISGRPRAVSASPVNVRNLLLVPGTSLTKSLVLLFSLVLLCPRAYNDAVEVPGTCREEIGIILGIQDNTPLSHRPVRSGTLLPKRLATLKLCSAQQGRSWADWTIQVTA